MASAFDENDHRVDDASFGWTSRDSVVAHVDTTGLVRGLAQGTATIIAATDDVVGTASITVVPPPDMWRGIVVAPEDRCTTYNADDYRHSASVEAEVVAAMGGRVYEPYRGVYFGDTRETDIEHVIAKSEAHESGACAWTRDERRAFANDVANLCTPTFVSADFDFVSGGGRLEGSVLNVPISRPHYTSNVSATWLVSLNPPVRTVTVHQYPHWETWTARIDAAQRTDFIVGLAVARQAVSIVWPLPIATATAAYQGGTDAGQKILNILERCTAGNDGDMAAMLSDLMTAPNVEATREPVAGAGWDEKP